MPNTLLTILQTPSSSSVRSREGTTSHVARVLAPDGQTEVWKQPEDGPPQQPPYTEIFRTLRERGLMPAK